MKQEIKTTEAILPMPVLMIQTFNEDGSVDVMNAAWGTMLDRDKVALNLTETHKTVQNIKARVALEYILSHKECQKEDKEFDEWCYRVIDTLEKAKAEI